MYEMGRRICGHCKEIFISNFRGKIYCTKECFKKHNAERYKLHKEELPAFKTRFEIFKRDAFTCQYCGRNPKEDKIKLHLDHIIPESKGGKFEVSNLITSCEECNLGKSNNLLEDTL